MAERGSTRERPGILERQNIVTYVEDNLETFAERPLCAVDSLVLSWYANFRLEALGEQVVGWWWDRAARVYIEAACGGDPAKVLFGEPVFDEGPQVFVRPDDRFVAELLAHRGARLQETLRAECFEELFDVWDPESCRRLLQAMAASPRFRDVRVTDFVSERDDSDPEHPIQFSAVTLRLDDGTYYVAFRGTDATFAGWREDFDMTFTRPVPAQTAAVRYLEGVAAATSAPTMSREAAGAAVSSIVGEAMTAGGAPIVVGGHSKGGNLAVYAAAEASPEVQMRIAAVYSHDGPGFDEEFLASEGFARIAGRINKTMPQSSVVGMMLENSEDYSVVRSTSVGIFQHDPFSWVVDGCAFVEVEGISAGARHVDAALNGWISGRTPEERDRFTSELFELLTVTDASTMAEVREQWQTSLPAMAVHLANMDADTRRFMLDTVAKLAKSLLTLERGFDNGEGFVPEAIEDEDVPVLPSDADESCDTRLRDIPTLG